MPARREHASLQSFREASYSYVRVYDSDFKGPVMFLNRKIRGESLCVIATLTVYGAAGSCQGALGRTLESDPRVGASETPNMGPTFGSNPESLKVQLASLKKTSLSLADGAWLSAAPLCQAKRLRRPA